MVADEFGLAGDKAGMFPRRAGVLVLLVLGVDTTGTTFASGRSGVTGVGATTSAVVLFSLNDEESAPFSIDAIVFSTNSKQIQSHPSDRASFCGDEA
jgi:hypothetical protein